jgi:hypothetical protein
LWIRWLTVGQLIVQTKIALWIQGIIPNDIVLQIEACIVSQKLAAIKSFQIYKSESAS